MLSVLALSFVLASGADASARDWAATLQDLGVERHGVRDLLAVTPEMQQFAEQVAGQGPRAAQLRRLADYLHDPEAFAFEYDDHATLTARQAFERRSGNCVSSTILFIALARSRGIEVEAALATRAVLNPEREVVEDLVVVNNHLVAIHRESGNRTLFDFDHRETERVVGYRPIDDRRLAAIYLNNRAVERMIADELEQARAMLLDALRLSPDFVEGYGNLGVTYRRLGRTQAALDSYLLALVADRDSRWVRNNLRTMLLLVAEERREALADRLPEAAVEEMVRGDDDLAAGSASAAARSYERARRLAPDRPEPWVAKARVHLFRGRVRAARRSLGRALELDPASEDARYLLDALDRAERARRTITRR